jgi:hypothetical protein
MIKIKDLTIFEALILILFCMFAYLFIEFQNFKQTIKFSEWQLQATKAINDHTDAIKKLQGEHPNLQITPNVMEEDKEKAKTR